MRKSRYKSALAEPQERHQAVTTAVTALRAARQHLRKAGAHSAARYVQRALKSAQGAERHAYGRVILSTIEALQGERTPRRGPRQLQLPLGAEVSSAL